MRRLLRTLPGRVEELGKAGELAGAAESIQQLQHDVESLKKALASHRQAVEPRAGLCKAGVLSPPDRGTA